MIRITALDGTVVDIDDDSVIVLTGPLPHDPPRRTYITGPTPAVLMTEEAVTSVLARLRPTQSLAKLTRPDNSPVWLKGAAVTAIRPPIPDDIPPGEAVGAVLTVAGKNHSVVEDVPTASKIVHDHGGHI